MRFLWMALLLALPVYADLELCEEGRTFVYGCDPIEPLYQVKVELSPEYGGVELAYGQTPLPPEMKPASGGSCTPKKRYETTLKSGTPSATGVIGLASLGSEIRVTNLGARPVKLSLTGTPQSEPLPPGATRKFSVSTAQEEHLQTVSLPLWRISQLPEKKGGKVVCATDSKKQKMKVQVLLLRARAEEPGLWEESVTPAPTPAPTPN